MDPASELRREILAMIQRYGAETNMTVYQAIGLLEIVKRDLVKMLEQERE